MIRPFLYLLGYCVMSVSEARCADLVNALSRAGIVYHVIGSYNDSDGSRRIRLRVTPFSAMRISVLCESIGIEIRIDQKTGLPFLLSRLMKRPGLVVGAVLCCFIIILSGRVLWDIRIEGNNTVPDERIMTVLKECGVSVGCDKTELDIDSVENRFLIRSDEISWISVNVIGTVAEVEVREIAVAEEKPDIVSSNLVATKNGIVAEFDKVKGNIQVTLGEAVSEGQLLVGGMYGSDTEALRFVRSSGRVMAL
ncbi:MAG: sporulation protein YqfD, partial [Clostridia bacterium]|nr:sporulation protein YqfD [Clostridia bacterium]